MVTLLLSNIIERCVSYKSSFSHQMSHIPFYFDGSLTEICLKIYNISIYLPTEDDEHDLTWSRGFRASLCTPDHMQSSWVAHDYLRRQCLWETLMGSPSVMSGSKRDKRKMVTCCILTLWGVRVPALWVDNQLHLLICIIFHYCFPKGKWDNLKWYTREL